MNEFLCGKFVLSLERPLVMGIVNLTPDSFSGDGLAGDTRRAIEHARKQWEAGADILDIGAESSRPGAIPTSEPEELRRILPVLKEICAWGVPVSIDTYKPVVMREALSLGASMINDISGMQNPAALDAVAESDCGICLMHMQGEPGNMQLAPHYQNVKAEVSAFLAKQVQLCLDRGVDRARLVLDPGFGFGKTLEHNLQLFLGIPEMLGAGLPVLAGVSRKTMLGQIAGRPPEARVVASAVAAALAAQKGAKILRVHDVAATCDALSVFAALGG